MSKSPSVIPIAREQNVELVEYAEALLERCRTGQTIGFTIIENHPGETYSVTATREKSAHRAAGELLDAAMTRLGYKPTHE